MYLEHFGFDRRPFEAGSVTDFFTAAPGVDQDLERLRAALTARGAVAVVTGGPGVGKTAMLEAALAPMAEQFVIGRSDARHAEPTALLSLVLAEFGIDYYDHDDARCLREFRQLCRDARQSDRQVLILLDINALSSATARQILRLTLNGGDPAAPPSIVLQGPHRLHQLMNVPGMIQLRQRLAFRYRVNALTAEKTNAYIRHQVSLAGGNADKLLDDGTVAAMHGYVIGVPRLINLLMDATLSEACVRGEDRITASMIDEVAEALGWRKLTAAADKPVRPPVKTSAKANAGQPRVAVPGTPKPLVSTSPSQPAAATAPPVQKLEEPKSDRAKPAEEPKRPATGDTLDFQLFDDFLPDKPSKDEAKEEAKEKPPEPERKDPTGMHIANMQKPGLMRLEDLDDHLAETIFTHDPEMIKAFRTAVGEKPGGDDD